MSGTNIVPPKTPARNERQSRRLYKIITWLTRRKAAEAERNRRQKLIADMVADNTALIAKLQAALREAGR